MEWTALILPSGIETLGAKIHYFDRDQTRRVAYGSLLSPDRLPDIATVRDISREEASRRLLAAQAFALSEPDIIWSDVSRKVI